MTEMKGWNTDGNGRVKYYTDDNTFLTGLTELPKNDNLFSNTNAQAGYIGTNGELVKSQKDFATDYIDVLDNNSVTVSSFDDNIQTGRTAIAAYDENKNFLSRPLTGGLNTAPFIDNFKNIYWKSVTLPENTKYIRASFGGDTIQKNSLKKLELGNAVTNWLPNSDDNDTTLDSPYNLMQYYFGSDGYLQKSGTAIIDGQDYYFESTYGIAINGTTPQYNLGLSVTSDDYSPHNIVFSKDRDSMTTVDGYLTADSWYRPKDILENGTNWRSSLPGETRPVLMVWLPDKLTLANYINYMSSIKMINYTKTFTSKDNLSELLTNQRQIQIAIEKKIFSDGNSDYIATIFSNFVKTQNIWNKKSEFNANDHLQGGALKFVNDDNLQETNSSYRLFNRYPKNQKGTQTKESGWNGGYELLLANDIDNSNPVVQAEQLNWLYYLNHFGSIIFGDDDANFDGIRVDAVDNVDADLLQITGDYYRYFNKKNPNQNISILEDWDYGDYNYLGKNGQTQLTMDQGVKDGLIASLGYFNEVMHPMKEIITAQRADRTKAYGNDRVVPNYSFIRAHDAESQNILVNCIYKAIPEADAWHPTWEQVDKGFEVYINDMESTLKLYTRNNIPSMYAVLLTNKDTTPRVYYGDLFYETGQYMANKTIYADVIEKMMKYRIATVAGGQYMNMNKDVLVSVRLGKYIDTLSTDYSRLTPEKQKYARQSGAVVIATNDKDYQLNKDNLVIELGMAHAGQTFKAIAETINKPNDNLSTGTLDIITDREKTTNEKGQLIFSSTEIVGSTSPYHWGYFSMWVPKEATLEKDIREFNDTNNYTDNNVFHSGEVLDSHVIFEGFSNFTALPTKNEERANVVIQGKLDYFKQLGITVFEFAPQYRSSTDGSFLDSVIQNGYAFTDRYDMGFDDKPTKYGTVEDLRAAIKSLHSVGIQAMCDYVPDQIYNLPISEVVSTDRTNSFGDLTDTIRFQSLYYMAKTKSSGQDYQSKYGGKYLSLMMMLAPEIFTRKQLSTGEQINPYESITQWSAKYFNGTNTLGNGAYYVLKDWGTNDYFNVNDNIFLPKQLTGEYSQFGFVNDENGAIKYYSFGGNIAKSSFIQDDKGNWYYFDENGNMSTGKKTIINYDYYFLDNGIELINSSFVDQNGKIIYTNTTGKSITSYDVVKNNGLYVFNDNKSVLANGYHLLKNDKKYYWFEKGQLYSGFKIVDGKYYFLYQGEKMTSSFQNVAGVLFYVNQFGDVVSGLKYTDGKLYDFGRDNSYWLKKAIEEQKPGFLN